MFLPCFPLFDGIIPTVRSWKTVDLRTKLSGTTLLGHSHGKSSEITEKLILFLHVNQSNAERRLNFELKNITSYFSLRGKCLFDPARPCTFVALFSFSANRAPSIKPRGWNKQNCPQWNNAFTERWEPVDPGANQIAENSNFSRRRSRIRSRLTLTWQSHNHHRGGCQSFSKESARRTRQEGGSSGFFLEFYCSFLSPTWPFSCKNTPRKGGGG